MAQIPPVLQGPSDKERKYDRQLRLWAASGQEALETANILLVNSGGGTVGIETLKNLVLPGIGHFTIADKALVGDADLGVNFFLDESSKGKSRARCCTELLLELNPEVKGDWYPRDEESFDLQHLLEASANPYTMILYSLPLEPIHVELLKKYSQQHHVPLICVHSVGFYSYFNISLPGAFPVVETHPDENSTADMRLLSPWPELIDFAKSMSGDIDRLDHHDHGHLPMIVVLLHYLDVWQSQHDGKQPTSYADKSAFRKMINQAMRTNNPEGGEENFEEAAGAVMKHVVVPSISGSLKQVLNYQHQIRGTVNSNFWLITDAVKSFTEEHGCLPVAGSLPDMKAQSDVYIKLQNIYKEKGRADAAEVLHKVRGMVGGEAVDATEVDLFCTNARFIKLINPEDAVRLSLEETIDREFRSDEQAAFAGPESPLSLIPIYLALLATSYIQTATAEEIVAKIKNDLTTPSAASELREGIAPKNWKRIMDAAKEVSRAAGGELHNTSAVIGGMVAQEVIKIITKQYVPIDNTCIFDGIDSRCQILRL